MNAEGDRGTAAPLPTPTPELVFSGSGEAILLLHANGFPPGAYLDLARCLAGAGRLRGLEQRPFWPGEPWDSFDDWRLLGQDLLDWMDRLALARPVRAIGHSLGGVALAYAAAAAPERFHSLVLIEPVFLPPALLEYLAAHPGAGDRLPLTQGALKRRGHWPDKAAAFTHLRSKPVFERFSDHALWQVVSAATGAGPQGGGVRLRCPGPWEARIYATPPLDAWRLPPQLQLPTLALRGAETDTLREEAWSLWQALQPWATFRSIPSLGHLLPLEDGRRVGSEILDWWATLTTGSDA